MLGGKSMRTTLQLAAVFSVGSLVLFAGALRIAAGHPRGSQPFGNSAPTGMRAQYDFAAAGGNSLNEEDAAGKVDTGAVDSADDDSLKDVRKAAIDYVKAAYPNSKIDGVFTLSFARGNLYLAGADAVLDSGQPRRTLNLLVRLYTRRNGSQYFRAESLSDSAAARFLEKTPSDDVSRFEEDSAAN